MKKPSYDILEKMIIIGDSGVGKTCMLMRFSEDNYTTNHISTIGKLNLGIDFKIKTVHVDGKNIKLQIWDTAGQERFRTITETYYRGAHGIILAYDSNDDKSFDNIKTWMKQIETHATPGVVKLLIGNKCDIPDRKITTEMGQSLARQFGIPFFEASAKTGANIKEAFEFIAKEIKERMPKNLENHPNSKSKLLQQIQKETNKPSSSCCK